MVAGYSAGGVRLFHGGNGTVLGSVEANGEVLAVKRSGQVLSYIPGTSYTRRPWVSASRGCQAGHDRLSA